MVNSEEEQENNDKEEDDDRYTAGEHAYMNVINTLEDDNSVESVEEEEEEEKDERYYSNHDSDNKAPCAVTQATKLPVTQTKRNTIMATAALTSLLKSYTHRISAIVGQLNAKIHSQTRQCKYTHMI